MADTIFAPPIAPGFEYAVEFEVGGTEVVFPEGVQLRSQIRRSERSDLLGTLTTEQGLRRISDRVVEVRIPPEVTAQAVGHLMFDLVRTDSDTEEYLYLKLRIPVTSTVTRPE